MKEQETGRKISNQASLGSLGVIRIFANLSNFTQHHHLTKIKSNVFPSDNI